MNYSFLFPQVKEVMEEKGCFMAQETIAVRVPKDVSKAVCTAAQLYGGIDFVLTDDKAAVTAIKTDAEPEEGYTITIREQAITIRYSDSRGLFYAFLTLCGIVHHYGRRIPCAVLRDFPGLRIRGLMLDISRGKIPTLDTLKLIADNMAKCKMNHLQLYIEGYPFAYPQYQRLWETETPLTKEEIMEFDRYCRERCIELTPCQNSLGHMSKWLADDSLQGLAECENGFSVMGNTFPPTTLDVVKSESLDFVTSLFDSLLPCFSADYCNCCLDEPFELASGRNRSMKDQKYRFYTEYANRLCGYLKTKGSGMMMWGDIVRRDDSILEQLDKDIVILEWGYEKEYPFEERAKLLRRNNRRFCVCPGTSSWLSITGVTDNMLENIRSAAAAAYQYAADGMIVTDWGDMGHLQYLPVSWAGILTAASYSWSGMEFTKEMLKNALNDIIFKDRNGLMGEIMLEAGRYTRFEEHRIPCRTLTFTALSCGLTSREAYVKQIGFFNTTMPYFSLKAVCDAYGEEFAHTGDETRYDAAGLSDHMNRLKTLLKETDMQCDDRELVLREIRNSIRLVCALAAIREKIYHAAADVSFVPEELEHFCVEHVELWNARNKPFDCQGSLNDIKNVIKSLQADS